MLSLATLGLFSGAGFASLAGILVGTYCHAMAAAFGLSQLFLAVPVAYDTVRFAGAAYLLYLAWKTFRADPTPASPTTVSTGFPTLKIFRQGLLTNLLNPKMALFVLALFPQFIRPQDGAIAFQIMTLATVLNFIGLVVNGVVILSASQLSQRWSSRRHTSRAPQYLLASVFAGLACRLALSSRK